MSPLQSPRGTRDILPADQPLWQYIQEVGKSVAEQMGFQPITTPTYEDLALFQRSIGAGTDVMDKELFLVRGIKSEKEEYALRPEGTAGIVRSFIEHGMHTWPQPVKLYSIVNNFRYDRPQKGRYREHTQFDIEIFGDVSAYADGWTIYFTWRFLEELGLQNLKLKLNSLGTNDERTEYLKSFVAFLEPKKDQLSSDSQIRLDSNPLRILDSKDANDQKLCAEAPKLTEFFGDTSAAHFKQVQELLTTWNVPFVLAPEIVRGLDYYSHTTFEWVIEGVEGQQNSLGGGGRYDSLVTQLGGPSTGAVGAGLGLDRIMEAMVDQKLTDDLNPATPELFVIAADAQGRMAAASLIDELLDFGWSVDAVLGKDGMGAQMKNAARSGALAALILGEKEVSENSVVVKDLQAGEQTTVSRSDLRAHLRDNYLDETASTDSPQ
jgi:histidyl-tRNA synthetase